MISLIYIYIYIYLLLYQAYCLSIYITKLSSRWHCCRRELFHICLLAFCLILGELKLTIWSIHTIFFPQIKQFKDNNIFDRFSSEVIHFCGQIPWTVLLWSIVTPTCIFVFIALRNIVFKEAYSVIFSISLCNFWEIYNSS